MTSISRRDLLRGAGATAAAGAVGGCAVGLSGGTGDAGRQTDAAVTREPLETLSPAEADTLEAVVARLVPSDEHGPGAREARAAHYIDRALGGALASFRGAYREGLTSLDAFARIVKGASFAALPPEDQDALLTEMERDAVPTFAPPGAAAFFALVLNHTLQGTFGDPFYGGNRDFVGWDLLGYPGVRLAVTPDEQRLGQPPRPTHMSAYDYTMFSTRRPARAGLPTHGDNHGD